MAKKDKICVVLDKDQIIAKNQDFDHFVGKNWVSLTSDTFESI